MKFNSTVSLLTITGLASSQDIDNNDVPRECRSVCDPVVLLTESCDRSTGNDAQYINCLCTSENAGIAIPACEACVATYDSDGRNNDVNDIIRSCSFTTTSYVSTTSGTNVMTASGVSETGGLLTSLSGTSSETSQSSQATRSTSTTSTNAETSTVTGAAQTGPSETGAAAALNVPAGVLAGLVFAVGMA